MTTIQLDSNAKDNISNKTAIREEFVFASFNRAYSLTDYNIHYNLDKRYEFRKKTILADDSLTNDEKSEGLKILSRRYDYDKIISNEGTKRVCENCNHECLAILYCEHCIRNHLAKLSGWTSRNDDIDDLIQKCQSESIGPNKIIEWILFDDLEKVEYLTRGGFSEIYTAIWKKGHYNEWDSKEQQLKRHGTEKVILKRLKNVKSANRSWFDEAKSHLTISNKWAGIVQCYGLTQNPDGNYMLVMHHMDIDLKGYLKQNNDKLEWNERIKIVVDIVDAVLRIHKENAIHRDLHSGNILYSNYSNNWYISDLGFCGPINKPLESSYGNLPYIDPEVICGKDYTFASDIYSIGMLMWEISSGHQPFINSEHDYDLAMDIINGMRPKIVSNTPLEYVKLMEQCWDANRERRPNIDALWNDIIELNKIYYQNMPSGSSKSTIKRISKSTNRLSINISRFTSGTSKSSKSTKNTSMSPTSKLHKFGTFLEPKNATEEEQEAFHSKPYSFNIPDNIEDINKTNSQNNNNKSKESNFFKAISKKISKVIKKK